MAIKSPDSPYTGVPTVEAQGGGGTPQQERATPEAFGAGVGQAVEKAGDEGAKLVEHFQGIYNDSTARDRTTQQSMALSDAEEGLKSLKGNDAVAGLKDFQMKVKQIKEDGSQGLNAAANEKYLGDFSRMADGAIFRAGAYVGNQAQEAHVKSLDSDIINNVNQFAMNADNPTAGTYLNNIFNSSYTLSHTQGHDPATADAQFSHYGGEALSAAIKTKMASDPAGAQKLFDHYSNATFTAQRPDADGNMKDVQIPLVDAAHRAQIASEMGGEYRRQASEALQTSRMYAATGDPYDKNALSFALKNAGHSQENIDAEIHHLDNVQQTFGAVDKQYNIHKSLESATSQALDGVAITENFDPKEVYAAYPREPDKARDIIQQVNDLHHVASFVSGFSTRTPEQIQADLDTFKPSAVGKPIEDALSRQEWRGKGQSPTSIDGAVGNHQIMQGTFDQYAKPGEKIDNPKDNDAVFHRIVDDYKQRYPNDPARQAVAYFSGTGNVAPAGNPTPWINDAKDGNGKSTSSYVGDVMGRMNNTDYAGQDKLYRQMQTATTQYFKKLYDDPAGTIAGTDPYLTDLSEAAAKDPKALPAYVDASLSRQEALGIPEGVRSALPVQQATAMADSIMANPESAPQKINQLAQASGDRWPSVYRSLVTHGDLPPYYQSIQQLGADPTTERDASLLARWRGEDTKGKTDSDLLGPKVVTDMKTNISANGDVNALMLSLYRSGSSKGQVDDVLHSIESLAFAKQYYDKDPTAAQNAIDSFTSKYEFMPNGGARVPKESMDAVSKNAQAVIENLENLAAPSETYNTGYHGLPKPKEYFDMVRAAPTWVTSSKGDSIVLKNSQDRFVLGKDGKPITIPFSKAAPIVDATKNLDLFAAGSL